MITLEQYKYILTIYDSENVREENINKKAQIYLSICSFILSAHLFKVKDILFVIKSSKFAISESFIILTFLSVFISLIFILVTLNVFKYQRPTSNNKITAEFDEKITDNDFFINRTADLLVSAEFNSLVNNRKIKFLKISLMSLIIGVIFDLIFLTSVIYGS